MKPNNTIAYILYIAFVAIALLAVFTRGLDAKINYAIAGGVVFGLYIIYVLSVKVYRDRLKQHYGYVIGVTVALVALAYFLKP